MGTAVEVRTSRGHPCLRILAVWWLLAATATAIPTPDTVINVFGGLAQICLVAGTFLITFWLSALKWLRKPGQVLRTLTLVVLPLLLTVSLLLNLFQYRTAQAERVRFLQENLVRPSLQDGKVEDDDSVKTLDMSAQVTSPLGLTPQQVAERAGTMPVFDVRETEEYAGVRLPGSTHVRYPDVMKNPEMLRDLQERPLLLCFSGNRSGELAHRLRDEFGVHCYFMIGGYEKWFLEGRELEQAGGVSHPRDIPYYPNRDTLLEPDDVEREFAKGDVVFIDARYPKEFRSGHLPGAINIPLRKLPSEEIEGYLAQVPKGKRLIGAVYDKRSGFYAQLLGARLSARGHTWVGRALRADLFDVDRARGLPSDAGPGFVTRALGGSVERLAEWLRNAGLAILVLVLGLRLLLLPVGVRAEASEAAARRIGPLLKMRKKTFVGDRALWMKERSRLQREAGVRPFWPLAQSSCLLVIFLGLTTAVARLPIFRGIAFLPGWIDDLAAPDPTHVLPIGIGALLVAQIVLSGKLGSRWGRAATVGLGLLFVGLTWTLSAAIDLVIVTNLLASLGQSLLLRSKTPLDLATAQRGDPVAIVPLPTAFRYQGVGPKAARLSRLLAEGLPVETGFVLTAGYLAAHAPRDGSAGCSDSASADLLRAFDELGSSLVAVRSSALDEDGAEKSFAGVYESRLNVERAAFLQAVDDVAKSFATDRSKAYAGGDDARPCILVQRMVPAAAAGVLFTQHPRRGAEMLGEFVLGLGESLVSGSADPTAFSLGRFSGRSLEGPTDSVVPYRSLWRLARQCERIFGRPQDIEWAVAHGRPFLVQSRDITTVPQWNDLEVERARLALRLRGRPALDRSLAREAYAELLSTPTESSRSLIERLLATNGAVETVRRSLGLSCDPAHAKDVLVTVFGRLYVDRAALGRYFPPRKGSGFLASVRLLRRRDAVLRSLEAGEDPNVERELRFERTRDLSRLDAADLGELLERRVRDFAERHYRPAEEVNVVASFQSANLERDLAKAGVGGGLSALPTSSSITGEGERLLREVALDERPLDDYLERFGHRALVDYELSAPRFHEDPEPVRRMAALLVGTAPSAPPPRMGPDLTDLSPGARRKLEREIAAYGALTAGKESCRHRVLRWLALVRDVMVALGNRTGLSDLIFHLTLEEMQRLARGDEGAETLAQVAAERARVRTALLAYQGLASDHEVGLADLESRWTSRRERRSDEHLRGTCASGAGSVMGPVRRVAVGEAVPVFHRGEILVATFTETSLAPLFPLAKGLITEVGGTLSHAAIVAREFGLLAIVGVRGAMAALSDGDLVRLDDTGSVAILGRDRRRAQRTRRHAPMEFVWDGRHARGTTVDESSISIKFQTESHIPVGSRGKVTVDGGPTLDATVLRSERNGHANADVVVALATGESEDDAAHGALEAAA